MIIEGDAQAVNSWLGSNFDTLWCLAEWVSKIRKVILFFFSVSLVRISPSQVIPVASLGHFYMVVAYLILLFFFFLINVIILTKKKNALEIAKIV